MVRAITVVTQDGRAGGGSMTRLLSIEAYDSQARIGSIGINTISLTPWRGTDRVVVGTLATSARAAGARRWSIADFRVRTSGCKVTEETTVVTRFTLVICGTNVLV